MRIDEIIRIQAGFKQKSQGKSISKEITEKIEFNVIEALMGKIKGKKGKAAQTNPAYNPSLSGPRTPMWDGLWTKREPIMSDEEFEKEIKALAVEFAEKSMEIGNSGKGKAMINSMLDKLRDEYDNKQANLLLNYVSVVSPDRKAAYAKTDFTNSYLVNGNERNIFGGNDLMQWSNQSGWSIHPTDAEIGRLKKFNNLFIDTLNDYETEHGVTIPRTTISKAVAPVRNYL